jgi:GNAT superfamily N-acetyltransferase
MSVHLPVSEIDTQRFGMPVARMTFLSTAMESDAKSLIKRCKKDAIALCFIRCPAKAIDVWQTLLAEGSLLVDTLLTWECDLKTLSAPAKTSHAVRQAKAGEGERLKEIVVSAFATYRGHYANDARLPRQVTVAIYQDWIASAAGGQGDERGVLVMAEHSQPAGFILLSIDERKIARVDLVAVDPVFQSRGFFENLMTAAIDWAKRREAAALTIETQLANERVHRVCRRLGFNLVHSEHQLHYYANPV